MAGSRTFGIVAHVDAGKTTLTERILFDAGVQRWAGSVDDGTATMDWMPAERARGISITAAATRVQWAGHLLQIVDTPGHVDFVAEVQRCVFAIDGVVVVVDGIRGVESQTEAVWHAATERALPRLVFVNKLDRQGADFARVVAELADRFGSIVLPLVVPLTDEAGGLAGLGHALTGSVQWFAGELEAVGRVRIAEQLRGARERVLEVVADADAEVMRAVVEDRPVPLAQLRSVLRRLVQMGRLVPAYAGSALWNRGVDWLLDGVIEWLPGPGELASGLWALPDAGRADASLVAVVFKVQHADATWNFLRVVRGRLKVGDAVARHGDPGRAFVVSDLRHVHADRHQPVDHAEPGAVVVLVGEHGLRTGDPVCALGADEVVPVPAFAEPVLSMAFEPDLAEDQERLFAALAAIEADDPTLRVTRQSGRILVAGMGELHLEVAADLVRERTGMRLGCSRPIVSVREVPLGCTEVEAEVHALVDGIERVARCRLALREADPTNAAVVIAEPGEPQLVAAAERELRLRARFLREGPLHGCEIVIVGLAWLGGTSCVLPLLESAAAKALELALDKVGTVVHEPWVAVEVTAPPESAQPVLADLAVRGVALDSVASGALGLRARGSARLAVMLGYISRLRSITRGLGRAQLRPAGFQRRSGARECRNQA